MEQDKTPLIQAIEKFRETQPAYFRIPGHRFARGVDEAALALMGERAYSADLTEAEGLDDLHQPTGAIREAEALAADLYGSDRCWFLVNGTTSGNEAMILACVRPGEKILVPRNAHKSALMGLVLSGAVPVWIRPEPVTSWGIYGAVRPGAVRAALDEDPDIRAVFLVSPTYYGICSDVREIAAICHARGVPLLVDEAHGAHLYFSPLLPEGALAGGADAVSQSTHKTVGSMTQSSMLHLKSRLIDPHRLDDCVKLVTSTSPNYLLMASLDGARHLMAVKGRDLLARAAAMTDVVKDELRAIPGIDVLEMPGQDPLRLCLSARRLEIGGYQLQRLLWETGHISCELSDFQNVVLVITWGNTGKDVRRLVQTVRAVADAAAARKEQRHAAVRAGRVDLAPPPAAARVTARDSARPTLRMDMPALPAVRVRPRDAFYGRTEAVPLEEAPGRVAAESVTPYPPGIPLLCPGEVITREICDAVTVYRDLALPVHGPADETLQTLLVLQDIRPR